MSRVPVADVIAAVKRVPAFGERVYPGVYPQQARSRAYPFAVVKRTGGAAVATVIGGGEQVPLIEIAVYGDRYGEVDAAVQEVELQVEALSWSVWDPPADDWHEDLSCHTQTIHIVVEPR